VLQKKLLILLIIILILSCIEQKTVIHKNSNAGNETPIANFEIDLDNIHFFPKQSSKVSPEIFLQTENIDPVSSIRYSPDGKHYIYSCVSNGTIILRNTYSGEIVRKFIGHYFGINSLSFIPGGKYIISGAADKTIKLWELDSGKNITFFGHASSVNSLCFDPFRSCIISCSSDNTIKIWDIYSGKIIKTLREHTSSVNSVDLSKDGKYIISGSSDKTIKIWYRDTLKLYKTIHSSSSSIKSVKFSPDGKSFVYINSDNKLKVFQTTEPSEILKTYDSSSCIFGDTCVSFSPNGKRLAFGSTDQKLQILDVFSQKIFKSSVDFGFPVISISFSPDNNNILSAGNNLYLLDANSGKLIKDFVQKDTEYFYNIDFVKNGTCIIYKSFEKATLWNVISGKKIYAVRYYSFLNASDLSPDGNQYLSANTDENTVSLWDLKTEKLIKTFPENVGVTKVRFSPDGKLLLSGNVDNIKIWDISSGELIREYEYSKNLQYLFCNIDITRIVAVDNDDTIKIWGLNSGKLLREFKEYMRDTRFEQSFSSDGKRIITLNLSGKGLKLLNVDSGKLIKSFDSHFIDIDTLSFSPDGTKIISARVEYNNITLLDADSGEFIKAYKTQNPKSVNFSHDGKFIVSGNLDNTVNVWNVNSGELIRSFKNIPSVWAVNFRPDGNQIVSGSLDGTIRILDIKEGIIKLIIALLPEDQWLSWIPGQLNYNSSEYGDNYAAVRFDNSTWNYKPLAKFREQYRGALDSGLKEYKPLLLARKETTSNLIQINLTCTVEGKEKAAIDVDEEIEVFAKCSNKTLRLKFNEEKYCFTYQFNFPHKGLRINVSSEIFEPLSFMPDSHQVTHKMYFSKPVLYLLINPDKGMNVSTFKENSTYFELFKQAFYEHCKILNADQNPNWENKWLRTYFYSQKNQANKTFLFPKDDMKTFINKINFGNHSVDYARLIDSSIDFLKGFSISDKTLRSVTVFIGALSEKTFDNSEIQRKLQQNKIAALIVQLGKTGERMKVINKSNYLTIVKLDIGKEFLDVKEEKFFLRTFEKIRRELKKLMGAHGFKFRFMN